MTAITDAPAATVFECPAYRYDEFIKRVDRANRRLERAGGSERFAFTFETFEREVVRPTLFHAIDGTVERTGVFSPWFRATLVNDSFRITAGDYTFVATLIAEEAGYTVHTAPGQSLDGWTRPDVDDIHCDVCSTVRRRQNIYIVRNNTTGDLIQVGSNCIAPLIGYSPRTLWSLTWTQELAELGGDEDEDGWDGYRGAADRTVSIDSVLKLAWAYTNGGRNYVSTKVERETDGYRTSTSTMIREHITLGRPKPVRGNDDAGRKYDAMAAASREVTDETVAAIKASAATIKAGTDYAENMRVILAAESGRVTFRNIGILGSLVSVYSREQQLRAESQQQGYAEGFIGQVKDRIRNFTITLTNVREIEGNYGTTTLLVGKTADNHVVKWFASGSFDLNLGDEVTLEAATVKAHENYRGVDQTVITRGKIAG